MALFAMMFKWQPDVSVGGRDVWLGASLTALFFEIGKAAIGFYIGKQGLESTYGAAASIVVVLIWVYYTSQIILMGRGGHPQLRKAQRLFQAPRPRRSAGKPATAVAVPTCAEPRATVVVEDRLIDEHRSPRPSTTGKGPVTY